jgi:glycosyltransferase involved in cell wall biosynthesis
MEKVIFFIGSLQAGGTEAKLARNFLPFLKSRGKIIPKLLLLQDRGEFLDVLPNDIEKICLNETASTNILNIIPKFSRAIAELNADVVISCMWYPAIISYLTKKYKRMPFKHIVHDTTNMTEYVRHEFIKERYKWLKIHYMKLAYKDADSIIVVSRGEKEDLVKNFSIPENLIQVIYNPMDIERIRKMAEEDVDIPFEKPTIVSVGRLIYSKGYDILLKAFQKVRHHIDCKLLVLGTGEEKEQLLSLSKALNISEDVTFLGFHHNPFKYMRRAQVFCTATRYEGLGNAIIEAMVLGLPVIATDCHSGPGESLDNGKYGILVPPENPDAIAEALITVLSDNKLRETLSDLSLKRAKDFDLETSLKQWEDVILGV